MPELVTITIDDVEYQVPAGLPLTQAARKYLGIDIPVFCAHPKLDPIGACRMCLVEVESRGRWQLVTACTTPVTEGMKVRVDSELARQAREDTLEFILVNHPLDCPICDKGGECPLQDQTLAHGPGASNFQEIKTHKNKRYPISDLILLDQERCIICWRCIRYLEEWEDKPQLGLFHRGGETVIDYFPEQPAKSHAGGVDAKTSGNIIDLCPVGALTNRVSRFRYRPWELKRTDSICTHCSQGCNVRLDVRTHQLRRIVARESMAVNDEWICDKGRFFHAFVDHPERLTTPLVRDEAGGELREAGWDEALARVAERLAAIAGRHGPNTIGAIGSAKLGNEAAYLLQKFMRGVVGSNNVDHRGGGSVLADPRGLPNIRELDAGRADVIVFAGVDPAEEQPVLDLFVRRAITRAGARLVVLHPRRIEDARYAEAGGAYVAYKPGEEVALFDALSGALLKDKQIRERVSRVPGFADLTDWIQEVPISPEAARAAALVAGAQRAVILYGPSLVSGANAEANRAALHNFTLLAGCADRQYYLAPEANSVGVRDMGLLPHALPGHADSVDEAARARLERLWGGRLPVDRGLTYEEMLDAASGGRLKALLLVGSDPASEGPAGRTAVEGAEFVVVQELFLTESARLADVVLPAVSWAEGDGTYTNLERRVQRAPKALANPHSKAAPDWSILTHLAQQWPAAPQATAGGQDRKRGKAKRKQDAAQPKPWTYGSAQAVLDEISRAVPMYADISWAGLGEAGKQWPWEGPRSGDSGSGALAGPPRRFALPDRPRAAATDGRFPFALVTGRVLFDAGTLVQATDVAEGVAAAAVAAVNPADAEAGKLAEGQVVSVSSVNGVVSLPVSVDETVQRGTIWIPYSLAGAPAETLVDASGDGAGTPVSLKKAQ